MARNFAVIDTETNWKNEVMSIGVLTANSNDFQRKDSRYYILPKEEAIGGMYSSTMRITSHEILTGGRKEVISVFLLNALIITAEGARCSICLLNMRRSLKPEVLCV